MQRVLALEQTPPLGVPLRYFLTAPVFAIGAGLLLLWNGGDAFLSRWTPAALAATHMVTLGVLAMAMIGALLQILPVVAGVEVPRPNLVARATHLLLTVGTALLSAAFLLPRPVVFTAAVSVLLSGFSLLLIACWAGLRRCVTASPTLPSIRKALFSLGVTVCIGAVMALAFAKGISLPLLQLTELHVLWGLAGWVGLLLAGVAYQIVPMFQVTPIYPQSITRLFSPGLFGLLIIVSVWMTTFTKMAAPAPAIPILLIECGYAVFALTTLALLRKRKRPAPETSTLFWYVSMLSLLAGTGVGIAGLVYPAVAESPRHALLAGMLLIVGCGYSVVNGMLYKIVPFLVWYHLQARLTGTMHKAPNVRQIIPEKASQRQFSCHLVSLVLLLLAVHYPDWLTRIAAIVFIASSALLWANLVQAARIYRRTMCLTG